MMTAQGSKKACLFDRRLHKHGIYVSFWYDFQTLHGLEKHLMTQLTQILSGNHPSYKKWGRLDEPRPG